MEFISDIVKPKTELEAWSQWLNHMTTEFLNTPYGTAKHIQVDFKPSYNRFWFINQADKKLIQISDKVHKGNAAFYRHKYRQYTTIKQPLTMIERLPNE